MKNIFQSLFIILFAFSIVPNVKAQTPIKVSFTEAKGSPGDTVCVDIKVDNFVNISAMNFTIAWDAAKLDFVNFNNINPLLNIPGFTFASPASGKKSVIYENATGWTTIPNGGVLMSACFKIKMPVGDKDSIAMASSPTPIEFSDKDANIVPFETPILKGLIESVLPTLKPVKLIGTTETVKQGDTACVVYTIADFIKIKKLELNLGWDPAKLKFEYISMLNTQFAPNGTSTPFYTIPASKDKIEIKWDASLIGQASLTLPDNTILFKLCFKAIGNQGDVISIPVATSPAPNVITTTSNNNNVGLSGDFGKVVILKTDFDPVEINIPSYTADAGTDFCIDITASKMDSIIGLQYTMQWDPEALSFKEIKNLYPFPNTTTLSFNTLNAVKDGYYVMALNVASDAFSLPANTVLYQVCFTPTGLLGCTDVKLTSTPTSIQAYNNIISQDIGVNSNVGKICVTSAIKIVDTTIVVPNCKNPLGGKIDMTVTGGKGPYTYQWSPNAYNATTEDVDKLPQGIFYVTITDKSVPANIVVGKFEVLADLTKPKVSAKYVGTLECKQGSVVTLDGTGSATGSNITYQWTSSNGIITTATDLITAKCISASDYTFVVTDTNNGCTNSSQVITVASPDVPDAVAGADQNFPCGGLIVQLNACTSKPSGQISYKWSTPNGAFSSTSQTPSACNPIATKAGTYFLTVTNTTNGCTAVEKTTIFDDPNKPIAIAKVKDTLNCDNPFDVQLFGDESLNNTGASNGSGLSYTWSPMTTGFVQDINKAIATAEKADKYILTVKNTFGCIATDTIEVFDLRKDTVSIVLPPDIKLTCQGNITTIDASKSSSGPQFVYLWTGGVVGKDNGPIASVNKQGKYTLTITNKYSKCSATASINVYAADVPVGVDAGAEGTLTCLIDKIQLQGDAPNSTNYKYEWTSSNGATIVDKTTLTPTVTKGGIYYLKVTNTQNQCVSTDSVKIVENKEKPEAKISGEKIFTCDKDYIVLSGAGSSNVDTYVWTASNGGVIENGSLTETVKVTKAGTYGLKVTRDDNGCTDSTTHIITFQLPEKGFAGVDTVLCTASPMTLTATLPLGGSGEWSSPDGIFFEDKSNNVTEIDSLKLGKNTLIWTSSASGTACQNFAADTMIVLVEKAIRAKDDLITQKNKSEYFPVPVTVNDDLKGTSAWILKAITKPEYGNLDTVTTKSGFKYKPSDCYGGTQLFKYSISSKYCPQYKDTAEVKMIITSDLSNCGDVTIPNTITPNGDGLNDVLRIDAIEFQPERFKDAELTVFNRWGDVVYHKRPYKNEWQGTNKNGESLPQGTYYYTLNLNLTDGVVFKGDITILK